ncbi:MAG: phosphofructokinase, partial [Candidatus Marinimicrobia bacterium]|nr:phosphofructokinase [Candidatus Neomarinimicrobiota bacterium]
DLVQQNISGRLVNLRKGTYGSVPIDVVISQKKVVDIHKYYNAERLRPKYEVFDGKSMYVMTSDV